MNTVINKRLKTTTPVYTGSFVGGNPVQDIVIFELISIRTVIQKDFAGMAIESRYLDSTGKELPREDRGKTPINGKDEIEAKESLITLANGGGTIQDTIDNVLSVARLEMFQKFGVNPATEIIEEIWNEELEIWE